MDSAPTAKVGSESRLGRSPLLIITFTVFVDLIGFGIIIPIFPYYAQTLGASPTIFGLLIAAFSVTQFAFSPIFGRLSDRFGRKPILLATLVSSTLGHLVFALAGSLSLLLLSRVLAGIAGANLSVAQAYIADSTAPKERIRGFGLIGAAFGVGFTVGPSIGGFFSQYGLGAPGFAAAGIAFTNFVLAFLLLPESLSPSLRGLAKTRVHPQTGFLRNLRSSVIGALLITFFIVNFSFSTIPVSYPLLGIALFNLGPGEMAAIFTYVGAVQALIQGVLIRRLVAWAGEKRLLAAGALLMALSIGATPLIPNLVAFFVLTGLMAVGLAFTLTLIPSLISKQSSASEQGSNLGLGQSVGSLARIPGPIVGGLTFEYLGMVSPFLISAVLMFIALLLGRRVFSVTTRNTTPQIQRPVQTS